MSEEEGLVLRAVEAFQDLDQVRLPVCQQLNYPLLLLHSPLSSFSSTTCGSHLLAHCFHLLPPPPFPQKNFLFVSLLVLFSSFSSFTSFAILLPTPVHRHVNPCLPPPPPTPPPSTLPLPGQH